MSAATAPTHWRDAFSRDEIAELVATNDWRAWFSIALDWGIVAGALALAGAYPNPFTILLAIALVGTRQLGFAVMMHEAAHQTLFRNRKLNDWVGNWLCAYPIWADLHPYRKYHLKHHAKNWTKDDPDLDLAVKFPVTRESLRRKIWRDLTGQIGWKRVKATLRRDLDGGTAKARREGIGVSFGKTADAGRPGWHNLRGVVVTNLVLLGLLALAGHAWLYGIWVVAWFTVNSLVTRIRSIAEHAMPTDRDDDLKNTRTTQANPLARLFIAPNRVNYHLEHHLLMTVPFYNLPKFHRLLRERGLLEDALLSPGYLSILRQASSKAA